VLEYGRSVVKESIETQIYHLSGSRRTEKLFLNADDCHFMAKENCVLKD
jgi:hypothetical protein